MFVQAAGVDPAIGQYVWAPPQRQTEPLHVALAGQALPQAPQFVRSVARSTQVPLHASRPGAQLHTPALHRNVAMQAVAQSPQ